jgi:hypothetical protein
MVQANFTPRIFHGRVFRNFKIDFFLLRNNCFRKLFARFGVPPDNKSMVKPLVSDRVKRVQHSRNHQNVEKQDNCAFREHENCYLL